MQYLAVKEVKGVIGADGATLTRRRKAEQRAVLLADSRSVRLLAHRVHA